MSAVTKDETVATEAPQASETPAPPALAALTEGPHGFALCEPLSSLVDGARYLTLYRQRAGGWVWLGSIIAPAEDASALLDMWASAGGRIVTREELDGPVPGRSREEHTPTELDAKSSKPHTEG